MSLSVTHPLGNTNQFHPCEGNPEAPDLARHEGAFVCCVPGTAHVLKGESFIATRAMIGKSLTQPDGGEGCSVMATGIR